MLKPSERINIEVMCCGCSSFFIAENEKDYHLRCPKCGDRIFPTDNTGKYEIVTIGERK